MRRPTFNEPHELRNAELWIDFAKQVNVIRHDFQFKDLGLCIYRDPVDDLFKPNCDGIVQYLATIFRTENDVILARVHDVSIRFVLLLRRKHEQYITPSYLLSSRWVPYIPRAKARGFTALLLTTDESREVGVKPAAGRESTGHASGRNIVKLLRKKQSEYTPADVRAMHALSATSSAISRSGPRATWRQRAGPTV
jgi:hypothetical protein